MIRHLYNSRAEVYRLSGDMVNGSPILSWDKIQTMVDPQLGRPGELMCRLDLGFLRVGKDQPMPITAGRPPDRIGVLFLDVTDNLKAGDRIKPVSGPITGIFEVKAIPDPAVGFSAAHHMEVQVVEVTSDAQDPYPGAGVQEQIVRVTP